jgi:glycosyltransferase involved in cell wall biosynthesis
MKRPDVSVITPTYNRARCLPRLWASLRRQTLADFQWIVVDDGSTDDTRRVVESFDDPRIRYVSQSNQGVNAARNRGEREVEADCVAFLDSDDELLGRDALADMVATLGAASPDIGMAYFTVVDETGRAGLSYMEQGMAEADYPIHVCEQGLRGEFFSIYRRHALARAPWPAYNGLEALRHWRLARHYKALCVARATRIYHRDEGDRLTGAASAIRRSAEMARATYELIGEHQAAWRRHCPCQLGRYRFQAAMYQALAGEPGPAFRTALAAFPHADWAVRGKLLALLAGLAMPASIRQGLFLRRARGRGG